MFLCIYKIVHMETSILQQIRKKAGNIIEPRLLKTARVLEVRAWSPATMIEIDLHLPLVNMHLWQEIPYIRFRVGAFTYRDYTPTEWDVETSTCTVFIDAGHSGAGSLWAQQLCSNDTIQYLKTGSTHQGIDARPAVIVLGDESSIGHLLALQQMALPDTHFSGAVLIGNTQHRSFFSKSIQSPIRPVARSEMYGHRTLMRWLNTQQYDLRDTALHLAGNSIMVSQLRKLLKQEGFPSVNIRSQGFWQ
jgi:NADPH-dependent ferric siderophore reductase